MRGILGNTVLATPFRERNLSAAVVVS